MEHFFGRLFLERHYYIYFFGCILAEFLSKLFCQKKLTANLLDFSSFFFILISRIINNLLPIFFKFFFLVKKLIPNSGFEHFENSCLNSYAFGHDINAYEVHGQFWLLEIL